MTRIAQSYRQAELSRTAEGNENQTLMKLRYYKRSTVISAS
jgi:hypothetical protein